MATRDIVNNAFDGNATCIITSYAHLHNANKQQYLEITYTPAEPLPKVVVQSFVGAKAKGLVLKDIPTGILPSGRVVCVNKSTNELSKSYITELVKIIESRNKKKLSKLTVIAMLENCLDDEQRLWLHHTERATFVESKMNQPPIVGNVNCASRPSSETASRYSDRKSITCSEVSYSMGSFQRLGKCQGDFCSYCPDEDDPDIGAEDFMEGNVLDESRKARIRLRLATGRDASELQSKDKIVVVKTDNEPEGNDLLHVDVKPRDDNNPYIDSTKDDDPDKVIVKKTQARFVPFKSIALARQDMSDLEDTGECHYSHSYVPWPELLFLWWWRQGRGLAQKKGSVPVPATSGHRIAVAKLSSNVATTLSTIKPTAFHSGTTSTTTNHSSQQEPTSQVDMDQPVGLNKKSVHSKHHSEATVPYDLSENSYSTPENIPNNKLGQLSWYYSDARVCEVCYQVYRDIERRRKQKQNQLIKAQKKVVAHDEEEKGKEIEKRIFQQRKFVSRLASIPRRSVDDIATSPTSKYPSINPNFGSISTITGAPSNAVPPVPWKLSENNNREHYMRNGPSFVRHLPERVEQFQQMIYLDRLKNEHEIRRKKILGGDLDNDNDDIDESAFLQEEQARWNQAIGNVPHTNKENINMQPKKKTLRHPNPLTKKVSKNFNVDHLLHPWQRDMKQMREELEEVGYEQMVKHNLKKNYTKKINARTVGVLKRTTSLPPLAQGLQQGSLANTSQITLDSALNGGSYSGAGFIGLGSQRYNVSDTFASKSNYTTTSNMPPTMHMDDNAAGSISAKRNVSFDETSFQSKPAPVAGTSKSYAGTSNSNHVVTQAQQSIKSLTNAYDDDDGEDDDDDDDDDEGIGWSPFVIPQN